MATAITATAQPASARVLVQVTFTTAASVTLVRIHADGTQVPVRGAEPAQILSTTGVGWTGYDHEAPLDAAFTYRATDPGGATVTSAAVTLASDGGNLGSNMWLTHPLRPSLNRLLMVDRAGTKTYPARGASLRILGRADPIGIADTRLSGGGEIAAFTTTLAERTALLNLLADGTPLLLRKPGTWDGMCAYALIGDVGEDDLGGVAADPWRTWKLPYTIVARPVGDSAGAVGATWDDVVAAYPTWTALAAAKATWNDVVIKAGP